MARIISGKELSGRIKADVAARVASLKAGGHRAPGLSVILVGDDPASATYVAGKERACAACGITASTVHLPSRTSEKELLECIARLAADDSVDGILVQLPLPDHISEERVIDAIPSSKDVDGFHAYNVAGLQNGTPCVLPCTARGIIMMLEEAGARFDGVRAVVVGRSRIVGKPTAKMLMDRNATVTIAHSHTADLGAITSGADILVVATGCMKLIKADMVKPGAIVIDVGITRTDDGGICGDVDFEPVSKVASAISPVPGGVGPMTIACLMLNTLESYENKLSL